MNASRTIKKAAQALQDAFSAGDAAKAALLFTPDAVFEDMALHTRVEGQGQIQRYLTRGLRLLPYGTGPAPLLSMSSGVIGAAVTSGTLRCQQSRSSVGIPRSNLMATAISRDSLRSTTSFQIEGRGLSKRSYHWAPRNRAKS